MTDTADRFVPRFWPLFLIALGVRVVVVALGSVMAAFPPDNHPDEPGSERLRQEILSGSSWVIEPWYRWDAGWYIAVAEHGYTRKGENGDQLGVAFQPVMPICFAAAKALGLNRFWAGMLVVNLSAAAGAAVFARVAARLTGDRDTAVRAFVLLHAFPTSFFFSAPYNESFGLLFTSLALWDWFQDRPVRAAAFATLGSLARITGAALGVAALGAWLLEDRTRAGLKRAVILTVGSLLGIVLFWAYLQWTVGDAFAGLKAHENWGRKRLALENPWLCLKSTWDPEQPRWVEAFAALSFTVLGIRAWVKRGAFWGILTLVPIAQMLMSGTFLSGHRVVLACLPAFIEMADLLKERLAFRVLVIGFAIGQSVLLFRFVHWIFAG